MNEKLNLPPNPFKAFKEWFEVARNTEGLPLPDTMCLATADNQGKPSQRMVMWRRLDDNRGFCFFTDSTSRKGEELEYNPYAALLFHWPQLNRQVRIEGQVEFLPDPDADDYFQERPRDMQLAAWASKQSRAMESMRELDARMIDVKRRFRSGDIPRPDRWKGYRLVPEFFQFWQASQDRLHQSYRFRKAGSSWVLERLEP